MSDGTMTDIKPFQARNRVAVAGEKKIHHRLLAIAGKSDGQVLKPWKFALAGRSDVTSTFGGTSNCERTSTSILRLS